MNECGAMSVTSFASGIVGVKNRADRLFAITFYRQHTIITKMSSKHDWWTETVSRRQRRDL